MAKPVHTIVSLFERLPFEEQKEALQQLQASHEHSRSQKRAELEQQLAELGYDVRKEPARATAPNRANRPAKAKPKRRTRKNGKATSVKAKYRDGRTGETWSGRGRMASWLKAKQDAGENVEKYLLG